MYEHKVTFHNAASATATGTVMNTAGISLVAVQITGTFVATVTFEGSIDKTNYVSLEAVNSATGAKATTATAAGLYFVPVSGVRAFRCNLTWTSGTSITATGIGVEHGNTVLSDIDLSDTVIGAVTVASGGIASGAVASGAIASGAVASGAVASGAVASGAVASGAIADGAVVTMGTKADAPVAATQTTTAASEIALLKGVYNLLESGLPFELSPFGKYLERKTVTFSNTTGTVNLFTVTGDVLMSFVEVCGTSLTSAGGCNLSTGVAGNTAAFLGETDVTTIDAGMTWGGDGWYATPTYPLREFVNLMWLLSGQDIIATLSAQIDAGVLNCYCFWTPLSAGASVVAA